MKIKTQKPFIIDAEFNEKTDDIPSFQEQIQERTRKVNVDDDNLDRHDTFDCNRIGFYDCGCFVSSHNSGKS